MVAQKEADADMQAGFKLALKDVEEISEDSVDELVTNWLET